MNLRNIPGPGDYELAPVISSQDPRLDFDDEFFALSIEEVAESLLDQYLADPKWIGEASASLTDAEYFAIEQAHAERNAEKLFAVRDAAVRRVLTKWAEKTAREDFEKLVRELESDAQAVA